MTMMPLASETRRTRKTRLRVLRVFGLIKNSDHSLAWNSLAAYWTRLKTSVVYATTMGINIWGSVWSKSKKVVFTRNLRAKNSFYAFRTHLLRSFTRFKRKISPARFLACLDRSLPSDRKTRKTPKGMGRHTVHHTAVRIMASSDSVYGR
jgi:hypothetical protein